MQNAIAGHVYTKEDIDNFIQYRNISSFNSIIFNQSFYFFGEHKSCKKKYEHDLKYKICPRCNKIEIKIEKDYCNLCKNEIEKEKRQFICECCRKYVY